MTLAVTPGSGQVIQTLDDIAKNAGAASSSTLRTVVSTDSPDVSKLEQIRLLLAGEKDFVETLWTNDAGNYYVRRLTNDESTDTVTISWTNPDGTAATTSGTLRPASVDVATSIETANFDATASGTGYSSGDLLARIIIINRAVSPPTVSAAIWLNLTTSATITAPSAANIVEQTRNVAIASMPATAPTAAKQDTGNTSLASILAAILAQTIAGNTLIRGRAASSATTAQTLIAAQGVGTRVYVQNILICNDHTADNTFEITAGAGATIPFVVPSKGMAMATVNERGEDNQPWQITASVAGAYRAFASGYTGT